MRRLLLRSLGISALAILTVSCSENAIDLASPGATTAVQTGPLSLTGSKVVISQVYGGGGNSKAPYSNDFIELFNAGTAAQDVGNWSVQYTSAGGSSWTVTPIPAGTTMQPGQYLLIQEAAGTTVDTTHLPTPDVAATIAMNASSGKVVLSQSSNAVSGSCPTSGDVISHVGFGSITCATGETESWSSHTGTLANTTAAIRANFGCANTSDDAKDFAVATPTPRNSSAPFHPCGGTTQPAVDSVRVSPSSAAVDVGATVPFAGLAFTGGIGGSSGLVWSSLNPTIATVDANGVAKGLSAGTATIVAAAANGKADSAALTVNSVTTPPPAGTDVVISQVYGAGGNGGALFTNDYVELFNATSAPVAIGGWSVQYTSTTGTSWSSNVTPIPANTTLLAGQYYLVQLSGGTNGAAMPTADATGTTAIAAAAGKVILVRSGFTPTGACPTGDGIADHVYYGTASDCSQTANISTTSAVLRNSAGCATGSTDLATGTPAPRNSASPRHLCNWVPGVPVAVTISPASLSLAVAATQTLTASAVDGGGQPAPTSFKWSSSNTAVATIDANTGVVTALKAGTATLTATSANDIAGTAALTVNGTAEPASGIVITEILANPDGDETAREWFEVYNAGTSDVDLQGWEIRSAKSGGDPETHIIASHVVVRAGGFAVLGNNANKLINDNVDVAYTYPSGVITLSNGSTTEWLSLHTPTGDIADSVAYSPRNAQGTVVDPTYLPTNGTAREVIDVNQDNSVLSGSNWRDVTAPYGAGTNHGTPGYGAYGTAGAVTRIVIAPSPASVVGGSTQTMSGLALDALGRISNESLSWSSSDPTIATIDAQGVATGIKPGSVIITATAASGATGTTTLIVIDPGAPATITVSVDAGLLPAGSERRVIVSVKDHNGHSVSTPLTFSVSDPNILAVDDYNGRVYVRGVNAGSADIIATATNGVFGTHTQQILPQVVPTSAVYRNHIEFGLPTNGDPGDTIIITHAGYVSSYNPARGGPNWVSWDLNGTHFGDADRCNCFSPDQSLPASLYKVNDADYVNSGYDRGHMVQSESRTTTVEENAATFYMTNILPQAGLNNQQVWLAFETFLDDLAQNQNKDIYITAGGEYAQNPRTLNDSGRVAIPDYTWKIAVVLPSGQGLSNVITRESAQVYAVRMPNLLETATGGSNWQQYQTTVDAIEAATGYDFLKLLPDSLEDLIESNDHAPVAAPLPAFAGIDGSDIAFAATVTDEDVGDKLTYSWSFGDGSVATGNATSHTYEVPGTYEVRLIVTDSHRMADTTTTTATVAVSPPPTATFHATDALDEGGTIAISFTDAVDAHLPTVTYAFDCGAGYGPFSATATATCPTIDNGTVVVHGKVHNQRGKETEYSASVIVANVAPTASIVAPATVVEGSSIAFSLTNAVDISSADVAAGFTYAFACGSGDPTAFGTTAVSSCATSDDGTVIVTAIVRDKDGATSTYTANVAVTNAAPVVASFSGATILAGETYTAAGSFSDAGADTFTGVVDYGAGSSPLSLTGTSFALSNTYASAGTFTVTVTITDDDGGAATQTASVVVQTAPEAATSLANSIVAMRADGTVPVTTASTLIATLQTAASSMTSKDNLSGVNEMNAFRNQVKAALNSRKISAATATTLLAMADRIIASANH